MRGIKLILLLIVTHIAVAGITFFIYDKVKLSNFNNTVNALNELEVNRVSHINYLATLSSLYVKNDDLCRDSFSKFINDPTSIEQAEDYVETRTANEEEIAKLVKDIETLKAEYEVLKNKHRDQLIFNKIGE